MLRLAATARKTRGFYKMPAGGIADTFDRGLIANALAPTTALLFMEAIELKGGTTFSNFNLCTSSTAMSGGANQWMALFDSNRVQLAVTADQGLSAMAASTVFSWVIATTAAGAASSYTVPADGLYYIGMMLKATTMCTVYGMTTSSILVPLVTAFANSAQSAVQAFPFTAAALTTTAQCYYLWLT